MTHFVCELVIILVKIMQIRSGFLLLLLVIGLKTQFKIIISFESFIIIE